jgi:hypothetical protein
VGAEPPLPPPLDALLMEVLPCQDCKPGRVLCVGHAVVVVGGEGGGCAEDSLQVALRGVREEWWY